MNGDQIFKEGPAQLMRCNADLAVDSPGGDLGGLEVWFLIDHKEGPRGKLEPTFTIRVRTAEFIDGEVETSDVYKDIILTPEQTRQFRRFIRSRRTL